MRSTKIVATIGPASSEPEILERLVAAGMDVARLNFAHGSRSSTPRPTGAIRAAAERVGPRRSRSCRTFRGRSCASAPWPAGWRAGPRRAAGAHAERDRGHPRAAARRLAGLARSSQQDDVGYLADGAIRLRVDEVSDGEVVTRGRGRRRVASRQGINLPNVTVSLPAVSEEDIGLIDAGLDMGVDAARAVVRAPARGPRAGPRAPARRDATCR